MSKPSEFSKVDADIKEARREADKASDRLFNELYHDRARLEKMIANHVKLLSENFGTELRSNNPAAMTFVAKLSQFVTDNE